MAQFWTDSSLLFALQDDLTTPSTLAANEFVALLGNSPKVDFDTPTTDLDLMTGQVGAAPEVVVGGRSGKITVEVPLQGFKDSYDPTAENPGGAPAAGAEVIPPWFVLAANALGCNVEALVGATLSDKNANFWRGTFISCANYGAAKVTAAGTDSTHIQMDAAEGANHKAGQFLAAAVSAVVEPWLGFIKTKVADLCTSFDVAQAASANYDNNAANVYGSATAWQSDDQPWPMTAYWVGPNTKACYVLTGMTCEQFEIGLDAAETPIITFTFAFADFQMDKTKGGLIVPDAYSRTPRLVGNKGATLQIDAVETCGLESVKLTWSATLRRTKCHDAPEGISALTVVKPRVQVEFSIPHDADNDLVYNSAGGAGNTGSHKWQSSLELGTTHSFGLYAGPGIGKCLGISVPSGRVSQVPKISERDGEQAYTVVIRAGSYAGDSTDTAETSSDSPLDAIVKLGLA